MEWKKVEFYLKQALNNSRNLSQQTLVASSSSWLCNNILKIWHVECFGIFEKLKISICGFVSAFEPNFTTATATSIKYCILYL